MARCGVQTLLCKYNNPTLQSARILINKRSYYHPYEMFYYDNEFEGSNYVLCNQTTIGDINLELTRDPHHLMFRYQAKTCIITFSRRTDNIIYISIISCRNDTNFNIWIEKYSNTDKFVVRGFDPNFIELVDKIVEPTLAEIYRNHLPAILNILEI